MQAFQFHSVKEVQCIDGVLDLLPSLLKDRFKAAKVMIITDAGLTKLGMVGQAEQALVNADYAVSIFDGVLADPPEDIILQAVKQAQQQGAEIIIGLGGGSSMDVAKLVAVLALGEQSIAEIYGLDKITTGRLPLVQIPTTAGSGSEATSVAIVTTGAQSKMGIGSKVLFADVALLDPTLTLGLPKNITAYTGIDAMVHALEAFTSKIKKNPTSDAYAISALKLLGQGIITACEDPSNITARRAMLVGAMHAGTAFANAPVGAVHALAYPVGSIHHVPHGLSNSLMLPHVMRFNLAEAAPLYCELASQLGLKGGRAADLIEWFDRIIEKTGVAHRLRDVNIPEDGIAQLADQAMLQTRLLVNNPREVTLADAQRLYKEAW